MRCAACDNELSTYESAWRKKVQRWEDLCRTCRRAVQECLTEQDSYGNMRLPDPPTVLYFEDEQDDLTEISPDNE